MKIYKTVTVLFILAVAVSIISCGNGKDKEKLVKFYQSSMEFYKSDEFKTNILDDAYVENKKREIIYESGFESEEEYTEIKTKLLKDEEIQKLSFEMNTAMVNSIKEELRLARDKLMTAENKLGKVVLELDKASEEIEKTLDKDKEKKESEAKDKEESKVPVEDQNDEK